MGAGFNALAQAGVQNAERQAAEKDEQRKVTLKTLMEDAETPADKHAAIQAVYHKDPSVLKQHVENMTRKLTGKQTQPVVSPQQALEARVGPIAARGKTPEQQKAEAYQQQTDVANKGRVDVAAQENQQKQKQTFDLIDKYITDPDQNKTAKEDYVRKQAGIQSTLRNIPGAGGQAYQNGDGQWVRAMQGENGPVEQPMPPDWKPPAPKQPTATPKVGTAGGKNVYALLTPQGWVDAGTKQPLKDFRPLPTYAQTGSFTPVEIINNGQPGVGSFNRKTGNTTASAGGATPLPTGMAKDINANLQAAVESNTRLRTMQQNATDALKGNQQAMLSLVANHIGMTLGQQKGARINQAVWNEAIQSTPWLQGIEAKWGPEGYLKGVTLSPQQIDQMLELGKQRQQDMWTQAKQSAQAAGVDLNMDNLSAPDGKGASASPKQLAPKADAQGGGKPVGATGTVTYQGKKYWVDKDKNNLGEVK